VTPGAAMSPTERSLRDALRRSELMSARLVAELDRVRAELEVERQRYGLAVHAVDGMAREVDRLNASLDEERRRA
jgi:hypothetical protein